MLMPALGFTQPPPVMNLATEAPIASIALKEITTTSVRGSGAFAEGPKCLISQTGKDGLGHQLEGKLSCIAMASYLGHEYVHKPFYLMAHKQNPFTMEKFFGLGTQFRNMDGSKREWFVSVPFIGTCWHDGWLRKVEKRTESCRSDNHTVTFFDNCWDRMYCHGYMESGHWYKLVPTVQAAYYSQEKPNPEWSEGLAAGTDGPKVAVHIRRSDSSYQLTLGWYATQIEKLRERFRREGKRPPLFRVQTDEKQVGQRTSAR